MHIVIALEGMCLKKGTILIIILFFTAYINPFSNVITSQVDFSSSLTKTGSNIIDEPMILHPDRSSYDNGTYAQWTNTTFTADGNITEWIEEGIIPRKINGRTVYLAFDNSNVYVAVKSYNYLFDNDLVRYNKTDTGDGYKVINGDEDILTVGFSNGTFSDYWTWTASQRTAENFAYEHDGAGNPDTGTLPFIFNSNESSVNDNSIPIYNKTMHIIDDHSSIPIGTVIPAWFENPLVPTGSQSNVAMRMSHSNRYTTIEFVRSLNTGYGDDLLLNFTKNTTWFIFGYRDSDDSRDFHITTNPYLISLQNTPAELTFDALPSWVNDSLLLQGTVFDDYVDYTIDVLLDISMYPESANINRTTGTWSYLVPFRDNYLLLGLNNILITLNPPYEDEISLNQSTFVEDTLAPVIHGVTNISEIYPDGVPNTEVKVTIDANITDQYYRIRDLSVNLYIYRNKVLGSVTQMSQWENPFGPFYQFFREDIIFTPLDPYPPLNKFTYCIVATDDSNNTIKSANYTFEIIPLGTLYENTNVVSNSIFGSIILVSCLVVLMKFKKRRKGR